MQIFYLTIYTPTVKQLVHPSDQTHTSLSLVIGTSNSLYKFVAQGQKDQVRINSIIIDTWLEQVEKLQEKANELARQVGSLEMNPIEKSDYLRFEISDENVIAKHLLKIFEQFDRAMIILDSRLLKGFNSKKYKQIVGYFVEQLKAVMAFPYTQNQAVNEKLLHMTE